MTSMFRLIFLLSIILVLGQAQGAPRIPNNLRINGRIVGGNETTIEENPWQVSLELLGLHNCGGSIISPDTVVTAAHCIDGLMQLLYQVVAGTTDLSKDAVRASIRETIVHELYDGFDYDVGIIKLAENLTFSEKIQAIPLTETEPQEGETVRVTGWGVEHELDILTPSILRSVDVQIVNRDTCAVDYKNEKITERMVCAGVPEGGKDSCQGDSGGPLTSNGVLVGIVSWGYGCGEEGYPGVYTNVAEVVDWIKSKI